MKSLPELEDLILLVEDIHADADPLQNLTDSVILTGQLADLADEVIGHFVGRARESGATWAEIGECMGVTRQAAQKRFATPGVKPGAGRSFFLTRLADEARHVVRRAVGHARDAGSSQIGSEHLVLGLLDDEESRACRAITGLGVSIDEIRTATQSTLESAREPNTGGGHIPFSADSKKVLELALRETIRSGERRIGTEHILLGTLRDEKSPGARVLIEHGVTRQAVVNGIEGE